MPQRPLILLVALAAAILAPSIAAAQNPFDGARNPGVSVHLWRGEPHPERIRPSAPEWPGTPSMMVRLAGSLGSLSGKSIDLLRRAVDLTPKAAQRARDLGLSGKPPLLTLRVSLRNGHRDIVIWQAPTGEYAATTSGEGDKPSRQFLLNPELFDRALEETDPYWSDYSAPSEQEMQVIELPKPYAHGRTSLDARSLERIQGSKPMYAPTKRKLQEETLFVRLPRAYSPRNRPGLLIWMDPTPVGKPPRPIHDAADELNLICIGAAKAGNERLVVDRLQLAFDALATASRRWPIDPDRVYLIGVSGGGKMSSILLPSFPETFAGAVPIVGLSWYERIPTGDGRTFWAPEYEKPSGARLQEFLKRRMALITGPNDFNYLPMLGGMKLFERDKLPVRLFDIPGLGHEFPAAEHVTEAVRWVDEPPGEARSAREAAASKKLESLAADGKERREGLQKVINLYPWTAAAWQATEELSK